MSRRRRRMAGEIPWMLRQYGGAPVWLLMGAAVSATTVVTAWATTIG